MTKEEILAMKPGRDLDQEVTITIFNLPAAKKLWAKSYSTNISLAFEMEEEIARLGLVEEYGDWITMLVLVDHDMGNARQKMFAIAHASPETRCKAALLAKTLKGG